jgi:hypothetical protein
MTVVDLTLRALGGPGAEPLPQYARSLRRACRAAAPVFGAAWYGERYRALAMDAEWLAESLLINAAREGDGARELWALAGGAGDAEVAAALRQHALDESRHALMYLAVLHTAFPRAIRPEARPPLRRLSPRYDAHEHPPVRRAVRPRDLLDAVIQINLGEIRTRINQLLLTPVIDAYCPPASRRRLARILEALLQDETRHIRYTAQLIERALESGRGAFVSDTMGRRLRLLNRITCGEVGPPPTQAA